MLAKIRDPGVLRGRSGHEYVSIRVRGTSDEKIFMTRTIWIDNLTSRDEIQGFEKSDKVENRFVANDCIQLGCIIQPMKGTGLKT